MFFIEWIRLTLRDWILPGPVKYNESRDNDVDFDEPTPPYQDNFPFGTTRLTFDVMYADGGYVIQVRYVDSTPTKVARLGDGETKKLFVVQQGQDLGAKIQEILVMESLRMT